MSKARLNIGIVGYGFMGRTHSNAFRKTPNFFEVPYEPVLKAVCGRNRLRAEAFQRTWGYESVETDWRRLVERKDIDVVDIASPNDTHAEVAIATAQAGKAVLCEKPLGRNAAESKSMVEADDKARVPNMVWYNYRRAPAVVLAKELVSEGRLGRIFHYRAKFLQDWTISKDLPQGGEALWRLDARVAGSGVTGDLLAHCVDTALWLNGSIDSVTAATETFIKERKHSLTGEVQKVEIEDASEFLCRFANGSLGIFEATHYARGHKALCTFEINGEDASIHVTDRDHPYMKHWWVPGLQIGYEHTFVHQAADFLCGLAGGSLPGPSFLDGLATDYVTDAVLNSAKSGRWEKAPSP